MRRLLLAFALLLPAPAAVVRLDTSAPAPILNGKSFGAAGPYERVTGKAYFAVDPNLAANKIIADIDKAPRNKNGKVEFSADVYILRPRDPKRGNGAALYEVSNRGGKGMLGMFNRATGSTAPETEAHFGDGFLMNQGYTLVWLGWQFDLPRTEGMLRLYAPVATDGGRPITGPVRAEFIADRKEFTRSLGDRNHLPYPVANASDPAMTLTVRDAATSARASVPRSSWKLVDGLHLALESGFEPGKIYELSYTAKDAAARAEVAVDRKEYSRPLTGHSIADPTDPRMVLTVRDSGSGARRTVARTAWRLTEGTHLALEPGFEPGKIYELVYTAKDPALAGLGPAAIRDLISHMKFDEQRGVARAYAFGSSQSGRFLRTFLYYGFNGDEKNRKVFDGVMAHIAGSGRGGFNLRFAQPSRDGHPFLNLFYPVHMFPFTDLEQTDPEAGATDGILTKSEQLKVTPKIFYTNSTYEYWGAAAALTHVTLDGKQDASIPPSTRIYAFTGGQHGPAAFPPRRAATQHLPNPNPYTWGMRALLVAMDRWVAKDIAPPPSSYPKLVDGQLVPLNRLQFPKIAAVPQRPKTAFRVDYGPEFRTRGIISIEPPKLGSPFPILVPQVGEDGNELAGIRMPAIQAPLATYTPWNLRSPEIGAADEMFSMVGSFLPFPKTRADREKTSDPRRSIDDLYPNREAYLKKVESSAKGLAAAGYLLDQDVPSLIQRGAEEWDYLTR